MGSDIILCGTVSQRIRSCLKVLGSFLQQHHPVVSSFVPYEQRNGSRKIEHDDLMAYVSNIFGNNLHIFIIKISPCKKFWKRIWELHNNNCNVFYISHPFFKKWITKKSFNFQGIQRLFWDCERVNSHLVSKTASKSPDIQSTEPYMISTTLKN